MSILPIKTIASIQEAATKEVQKAVDAQALVIEEQNLKISKAEAKRDHAKAESTMGQTFIDNFNAMFTKKTQE